MFGCVVFNIPHDDFEHVLHNIKVEAGVSEDSQLSPQYLQKTIDQYKKVYKKHNREFLTNPYDQLYAATTAVFDSWMSDRAIKYREAESITGLLGPAVNIQAMVSAYLHVYLDVYTIQFQIILHTYI
jgi:pyruvate,orthophosphate dikinase